MTYLYGASVQGIQSFIFKTNELRDIAGASELVENICTKLFLDTIGKQTDDETWTSEHQVIAAAGNVKYILNEEECRKAVLLFPKRVMCAAPGITISQAVVKMENDFGEAINKLEKKLHEVRNRPTKPLTLGLLGMRRSPRTGLPAIGYDNDGRPIDEATLAKKQSNNIKALCKKSFGKDIEYSQIAYDTEDLTCGNDWIAIIHADGNGLGRVVQQIGHDKEKYKKFSYNLNEATKLSAQAAFKAVEQSFESSKRIPIRPVVLGGDDMTVIIRGSLGIDYVKTYLEAFEDNTKRLLHALLPDDMEYLTACAGIAFIKSSYPFYYGYGLAEELCSEAKKASGRKASCIMFHKVQDSFVTSYEDIVERELTIDGKPKLKFGPYYLNKQDSYISIADLQKLCVEIGKADCQGVKTGIRRWLTALHEGQGNAKQMLDRIKEVHGDKEALIDALTNECHEAVPAADALSLYTIINQKTR